jgi:uncharacterized protein (DUF2141 family)
MIRVILAGAIVSLATAAPAATLVIRAEGVRSADGMVYVGVCDRSFDEASCPYRDRARARAGTVEFRIPNVRPGSYAIAIFHDLNGDGKLDRNLLGLPNEPYGFSNDVGRRGIPSFQGALVPVREPSTAVTVTIR